MMAFHLTNYLFLPTGNRCLPLAINSGQCPEQAIAFKFAFTLCELHLDPRRAARE